MPTIGIIAEFNPFHNGHARLMELVKEKTGADSFICAMSGDFVQRGAPAICDKHLRTRLALSAGIDAVFELPSVYACSSAESFALGGTALLSSLKIVDVIAFGSESGDLEPLEKIAAVLYEEPEEYKKHLRSFLKDGLTFPAARQAALEQYAASGNTELDPCIIGSGILSHPNNILAIEYIKAAMRLKALGIKVPKLMTVKRSSPYTAEDLSEDKDASALALRRLLEAGSPKMPDIAPYLPDRVYKELAGAYNRVFPVSLDDFSPVLYSKLLSLKDGVFGTPEDIQGRIPRDMLNSLLRKISSPCTFTSLAETLKTKNYTYSAICRALVSLLLDLPAEPYRDLAGADPGYASPHYGNGEEPVRTIMPYARLLGFRKSSSELIKRINAAASCEIINKLADAKTASPLLKCDIRASRLYAQVVFGKYRSLLPDEYEAGIEIYSD